MSLLDFHFHGKATDSFSFLYVGKVGMFKTIFRMH